MATTLEQIVVQLDPSDPVALARFDVEAGTDLGGRAVGLVARDAVPRGHKVALVDLPAGTEVRKYGQPIGVAIRDIAAGEHVHDHNLHSLSREGAAQGVAEPVIMPAHSPRPPGAIPPWRPGPSTASSAPTGAWGPATTWRSSAP